uniref:Putative secreted protein n=1 Tax=Nyssomyia neivai TaxID=330878 RepID=A0A1L8DNF8_9DIPT
MTELFFLVHLEIILKFLHIVEISFGHFPRKFHKLLTRILEGTFGEIVFNLLETEDFHILALICDCGCYCGEIINFRYNNTHLLPDDTRIDVIVPIPDAQNKITH